MRTEIVSTMSDDELVAKLVELVREERRLTVAVLTHLGEVEARDIHLRAACSSMYGYCTRVLGMSEDQAFKRIRAARALRRFPVLATAVADGRLHLGGVLLLAPHLTDDNAEELVAEASGKSKAEIAVLLARRAPRADVPPRIDKVTQQLELAPGPVGQAESTARLAPLASERFALQVTIGEATRSKLVRAQALLRHKVPSGDLSELIDQALDALIDKIEKRKFGKTGAPRKAKAGRTKRYVSNEARREAVARDGMRCSFVSADGRRCEETGFLELDHMVPVALGGDGSDGVRILCRSHNQYEAERILGRETVEAGKAARALDDDLVAGLRRLGVTSSDARRAVAASRGTGPVEERMRAALRALRDIYAGRGERAIIEPCGASRQSPC
jgi:hypothetical protein